MADQSIAIRYRRWIAAVFFALAGLAGSLLVYSDKKSIAGAIIFLSLTLVGIFAARFTVRPLLLITKEGIHYKSKHFFPWHDITDIREVRIGDSSHSSVRIEIGHQTDAILSKYDASNTAQYPNRSFRTPEKTFRLDIIDKIFDIGLTRFFVLQIKPYHSTENLSQKNLIRKMKEMQRDYFIHSYQNGVMFLSELGRAQLESAKEMLALTEQAFRDDVISMNEYVREKSAHAQNAKILIELRLPDHLKGIYKID